MLSRDDRVHVVVAVLVIASALVVAHFDLLSDGPVAIVGLATAYGVLFGGAHLYLALRGEDGLVPVESRWRYLGALAVVIVAAVTVAVAGDRSVVGVELRTLAFAFIVLVAATYLVAESIAGYRATRPE